MISLVTFTGIDNRCDLKAIKDFCEKYKAVEFGVLLSLTPEDKDARYMAAAEIDHVVEQLGGTQLALHVCGSAVTKFVEGDKYVTSLARQFSRIQLNFSLPKVRFTASELENAMAQAQFVITQHAPGNEELVNLIKATNHQVLHDTSGGRGIATEDWQEPFEHKWTGYAGGLGPDNVEEQVARIDRISGSTPVWIDMESRVRSNGYLDLAKCRSVMRMKNAIHAEYREHGFPWRVTV